MSAAWTPTACFVPQVKRLTSRWLRSTVARSNATSVGSSPGNWSSETPVSVPSGDSHLSTAEYQYGE